MADAHRYALGAQLGLLLNTGINQLISEAQQRWLRPAEICEILRNYTNFQIASEPGNRPPSGSLLLFDRKVLRYFRKDGHNWRKKEAHEKLKSGSIDALQCYYARGEENENFQRRSYWLLGEEPSNIVLVHYLEVKDDAPVDPVKTEYEYIERADEWEDASSSHENKDTDAGGSTPGKDKKRKRRQKHAPEGAASDIGSPAAQKIMMDSFFALRAGAGASSTDAPKHVVAAAAAEPSAEVQTQEQPACKKHKHIEITGHQGRGSKKVTVMSPIREEDRSIASLNRNGKLIDVEDSDDGECFHEVTDVEKSLLHKSRHIESDLQPKTKTEDVGGSDPPNEEEVRLTTPDFFREWLNKCIPIAEQAFVQSKDEVELEDEVAVSLATLNGSYAELHLRTQLLKRKLMQVVQSHCQTSAALQEAEKAAAESESLRKRVAELEQEVMKTKEEKRAAEDRFKAANKQWVDDRAQLVATHDKERVELRQIKEKLSIERMQWRQKEGELITRAVKAEVDAKAFEKDYEKMKRAKKWLLEEGFRMVFEKVKVSDDYVKKLSTLTVAADALGRSEGLAAGYAWAKKCEPLESMPGYRTGSADAVAEAYAGFAGVSPSILKDIASVSEDEGLTGFCRLLLLSEQVESSTSSGSGSGDDSSDEEE